MKIKHKMILQVVFMTLLLAPVLGVLSFFVVDYIDPMTPLKLKLLIPIFAVLLCLFEGGRSIFSLSQLDIDEDHDDKLY